MPREDAGKPRGLLHPLSAAPVSDHLRRLPVADLAPFVEHFWSVRWDLPGMEPTVRETLPHPSVHMVLQEGRSRILGVVTGKFRVELRGRGRVLGVKFRPGGFYPYFLAPVSRLADRAVSIAEVFGTSGADLEVAILAADDVDANIELAERFLLERRPARDEIAERLAALVERARSDREITKVEQLADLAATSERTLQRLFRRYVGVGPKWVIQRYRLHEAAERLAHGGIGDWPALALELGYFDQAHFIRDFKRIVGRSPADYARRAAAIAT